MVSDAADGPGDRADRTGDRPDAAARTGSPLVDRWLALDRGWQALVLGLAVVAAHVAGQVAGVF
ncbi:hypothetical protein [Halorubrum lacusprofundi]|jgi:hypothetical protein|uniref:Uncharacterized protein n=1 Tax=Halorubrum lacusprofundi (strain ATCC 49239 / DSM 5036 / JCM 8891 / ACAM 34) TaxID=416348 RepID=B9LSW2_HALLT|nr:hypothetical protein [Halorubrum lacusprofundi]ACM56027.1 hypothetical protein Hlac_0424 [Halorubrum lacusprofundi ATCC 49239]